MNRFGRMIWSLLLLSGVWFSYAEACSVCHCGDNAFLFSEKGFELPDQTMSHRLWFSLGNLYSTKTNRLGASEGPGSEFEREVRPSVRTGYTLSNNLSMSLEVPLQFRYMETTTPSGTSLNRSSGLGDAEISAVWTRSLASHNGQFYTGGLSILAKLPTGRNNLQQADERLDEHLQAGTGSFDWQVGGAASRVTCSSRLFTSLYYRRNGTNDFGYHYGNAMLYNLGAQYPLTTWLTGSMQVNGRYARWDRVLTAPVDNTGGWVTYLSPGLRISVSGSTDLNLTLQLPIYQHLYGDQTEKAVLSTGISFQL